MPATIEGRHFYRFNYLRSEHWQNLRIQKLADVDAKCQRCSLRDLSNDVHHLRYKRLYDVKPSDLICLCRNCHTAVHVALDAAREAEEAKGGRCMESWRIFLSVWGGKPHLVHELWDLMRDMRKAKKIPKLKVRQKANLK